MTLFGAGTRDTIAFEAFAARSGTRLMRAAYLLCGDPHTAEDLLQVTMMRTARRWGAARSAPEAYARAVLINAARDQGRRVRRRVDEVTQAGPESGDAYQGPGTDHTELIADRDTILAALAELPQRQREVIVLRFYADLSVSETAAAIGASPGTVMSYTSRALTRLRELLAGPIDGDAAPTQAEVTN
jgi:RNA polymerase sigma-70 factor (sigma-E family)